MKISRLAIIATAALILTGGAASSQVFVGFPDADICYLCSVGPVGSGAEVLVTPPVESDRATGPRRGGPAASVSAPTRGGASAPGGRGHLTGGIEDYELDESFY